MNDHMIRVGARTARIEDQLHPFQRQVRDALRCRSARILRVEAPVGSGKSRIIRDLVEEPRAIANNLVLTYPTKILMEAQVSALRQEMAQAGKDLCVWPEPDTSFRAKAINLVNYSTDSLLHLLRRQGRAALQGKRGDLLHRLFDNQEWYGRERALITTPDVLHLIAERKYGSSKQLEKYLNADSLFIFDEFHLYHNLANFVPLLETILERWNSRVVLLSATPLESDDLHGLLSRFPTISIDFAPDSLGDLSKPGDRIFNHPLDVQISSFRTTDLNEWPDRLEDMLVGLPQPTAVILDSVHRLQWLKRMMTPRLQRRALEVKEWSGLHKDRVTLNNRTALFGTSAIEVGIDFRFASLIFEALQWPSAVQRLGRVGRFMEGKAILCSRRVFDHALRGQDSWDRTLFEQQVLKEALLDPAERMIAGEMFRGDSYSFALIDRDTRKPFVYDETLFAMFEIDDCEYEWRCLDDAERREVLREWKVSDADREEILLRHEVFPFWGVLRGTLRPKYQRVESAHEDEDSLTIVADQCHVFYRPT